MKLRRIAIENVRSFLERTELLVDGDISIIIGPNGGGKTNLLDAVHGALRRYLIASPWARRMPTNELQDRYEFHHNDALDQVVLERHALGKDIPQAIEVAVQVTKQDIDNIQKMKDGNEKLLNLSKARYFNNPLTEVAGWKPELLTEGQECVYRIINGSIQKPDAPYAQLFLRYLKLFEIDGFLRDEYEQESLSTPMIYLPVHRAANGFQSSISLHGFDASEHKRQIDAISSRRQPSIANLATGRIAMKYRLLQEDDNTSARKKFREDPNLVELTKLLTDLGYAWDLVTKNAFSNEYDIKITKQGTSFLVSAASSGERELLTYLFAIYALNVRDALIIVDEPELHLHPKWQTTLLNLFTQLSKSTGNQFLMATHSPTFVSPASIQYVSRVYSDQQRSRIVRLNNQSLPEARHLFNIVNSQNNERIFFADKVVLVEGITDRVFFEAVINRLNKDNPSPITLEVVSVGGKTFFDAYNAVLDACRVEKALIADRDYVEQVGTPPVKALFVMNSKEIKEDVVKNPKSRDGETLVSDIENALATGSWEKAKETWEYIKRFRRRLKDKLTAPEQALFDSFILDSRKRGICILSKGAIEAYLPKEYRAKNLDTMIRFVNLPDFWERLGQQERDELQAIVASFNPPVASATNVARTEVSSINPRTLPA